MAYISPNTQLNILRGVDCDRSYNHTYYFGNGFSSSITQATQANFFQGKAKYQLTQLSYQRVNKNTIRVELLADNLYDCNYLMFKNTAFGNKWFYAFIDKINYINPNCSEIEYTIDVMQTWYFDYTMGECFVEREHTATDVIGENIVAENLETGELITQGVTDLTFPTITNTPQPIYSLVVLYNPNGQSVRWNGEHFYLAPMDGTTENLYYNNVFCGAIAVSIDLTSPTVELHNQIDEMFNKLAEAGATICSVYQTPKALWNNGNGAPTDLGIKTFTVSVELPAVFNYAKAGRYPSYYAPRNNKLYTNPFSNIVMSNNTGQSATYRWEFFSNPLEQGKAKFRIIGIPIVSPEALIVPLSYKGVTENHEEGLSLTDFPQPPWSLDSFRSWEAQNREALTQSMITTAITSVVGIGAGVAVGSPLTAVASASNMVTSIGANISQTTKAKNTPDTIGGQVTMRSLNSVLRRVGYTAYSMGVSGEYAKIIDDYFTMFGYAIKEVKTPNVRDINGKPRPNWNYIKTKGAIIHAFSSGSTEKFMPSDDEEKISNVYDNGITFWNTSVQIGQYSLNNNPLPAN